MARKIGIFGGSFDPVHHGHLVLARDAVEAFGLERLVFVPASVNPHKLDAVPRAESALRLEMLRLATESEPRFEVDPIEILREGPSYTADTIAALRERWPGAELFFLLGEDNLPKLATWHRFAEWKDSVTFVSFGRSGSGGCGVDGNGPGAGTPGHIGAHPAAGLKLQRLGRRMDVSSTEIRLRIAQGLSIRYLVPESIRHFIDSNALYQNHE